MPDRTDGHLDVPPDVGGRRRNGTWFPLEVATSTIDSGDRPLFVLVVRDVAERDRGEAERRKKELRYRTLVEQLPAVTCIAALDEDVRELYVSPQIEALLGFSQEEWLANPVLWYHQIHPADRDLLHLEFARGCVTGGPFRAEFRALTRAGDIVWIHGEARVVRDDQDRPLYIQGVAYDISEEKKAEAAVLASTERLKASLQEKEVLLKEIHHRVKNNLQVISSLLKLQSGQIKDRTTLDIFTESQNRIRSMALVHEKLYASGDLSRIEFGEYVRSLTSLLVRSYGSRTARVGLAVDIEAVHVGIPVAVPLGLIINELVSNCCKYAFAPEGAGTIRVTLRPRDAATLLLSVADDGVGFPAHVDFRHTETLGMSLVRTLTDQIQGTIELHVDGGTEFRIVFPR
jgi:PAS domain S-box-containing protein